MKSTRALAIWRAFSLVCLLFLTFAYFRPSDALYALTIWPAFVWASLGVVLTLAGIRRFRSKSQIALLVAWFSFWLVFGEEKVWVPLHLVSHPSTDFLVVSLNCAGGSVEAAREALTNQPKIILLQESPSRNEIEKLAKEKSMSFLAGVDASILTTGDLEPIALPRGTSNFVAGIVRFPNKPDILVVSLRFQPPVFNLEYWNPDCWRSYSENRANRRIELQELADWIAANAKGRKVIVGGDFNTPPDAGTFGPFRGMVKEATGDSGYTAVNEFPMARIDQIWQAGFEVAGSRAVRTQNSDHRMVRCWFY
jgi:hypothetical protein